MDVKRLTIRTARGRSRIAFPIRQLDVRPAAAQIGTQRLFANFNAMAKAIQPSVAIYCDEHLAGSFAVGESDGGSSKRSNAILEALAWISLISVVALLMGLGTDDLDLSSKCRAADFAGDRDNHHCELIVRKPALELTMPMPKSPSDDQ